MGAADKQQQQRPEGLRHHFENFVLKTRALPRVRGVVLVGQWSAWSAIANGLASLKIDSLID